MTETLAEINTPPDSGEQPGVAYPQVGSIVLEVPIPGTEPTRYELKTIRPVGEEGGHKEHKIPALEVYPPIIAVKSLYYLMGRTPKEKREVAVFPQTTDAGVGLVVVEKPPEAD